MLISANMATFPLRKKASIKAIESIYDQVDVVRIYLNEYESVPKEYIRNKIEVVYSGVDLKSSGKVFWANEPNQYYFCIDDDILYPSNYVDSTIRKLQEYDDDVIVSYHGRKFRKGQRVQNYFKGYLEYYHFGQEKIGDSEVEVIGNGVSCWNTNNITVDWTKFSMLHMDDIFVSIQAKQQGKKRMVLEHTKNFLQPIETDNVSLYKTYYRKSAEQTRLFNSVNWWS